MKDMEQANVNPKSDLKLSFKVEERSHSFKSDQISLPLIMSPQKQLATVKEASKWATDYLNKSIDASNISYLIQYGKVRKHNGGRGVLVDLDELKKYYKQYHCNRESMWKKRLGDDLNWTLSFDHLREKDTTKHVHRLHPYKGKFIPQLVEYFIDDHIDNFKKEIYFKAGDIILDPFSGSGTTLVQANESEMHSIGIDISHFNCMIADVKLQKNNFEDLVREINQINRALENYEYENNVVDFEAELIQKMNEFNGKYFPNSEFKYQIQQGNINEDTYSKAKEKNFSKIYTNLVQKYNINFKQVKSDAFLDKWYSRGVRKEIDFAFNLIDKVKNVESKKTLSVILSRTIRSCRATTHFDLATLKEPQLNAYYCWKHKKICKPTYSIKRWFGRYAKDTLTRLGESDLLRTDAHHVSLPDDSRTVDVFSKVEKSNKKFYELLKKQKIQGIFTSPPYVGQINYHDQHAYAYNLFRLQRKDELEIGPLFHGQGKDAQASYVEGVSSVLLNCKRYLAKDFHVFLVANDKFNLYPSIAERAGLKIVNQFKRPVLNRTERDKAPYSEIIFHMQES